MAHNIPLMRRILTHITRDRASYNQSYFRHVTDRGHIELGVGGWAVTLSGGWRWIGAPDATYGQIQVQHNTTHQIRFADQVAADVLGVDPDEANFLMWVADDRTARAWLEDTVIAHERRVFDQLAAELRGINTERKLR
ncbi:hypothetical protein [Nocardia ignorata]|uniref:Uncharacterized protein n=1 Tax=Nocardia ignorata TaxID=145285 RepID=A0A4R6P3E4_NOCIG|nr:hypothetical protein [Nocardia ignorata]TDP29821.1 hypothetical protein DFR75_11289 [Nocardia ignorata]